MLRVALPSKEYLKQTAWRYLSFIGPGLLVSVAYIDAGNYSTSVSSGANYQYRLLFSILISNLFAVLLQSLCIKLGSITGLNLAEMCRLHLDRRLNLVIYVLAEFAIIATDLAEVVGTAIALEILFGIPLEVGILITVIDVLLILYFYKDDGTMKEVRFFEMFVSLFVGLTCLCFVVLLFKINVDDKKLLWIGFLPSSKQILEEKLVYLSLGILGATVMPHSLYLGSALVQPRLKEYDIQHQLYEPAHEEVLLHSKYKPSLALIDYCLAFSYTELIISLFFVAMFVNSSILIVAGATLYGKKEADDADLFSIYQMLRDIISPAAGLAFALAMLFSGQAAGIVCTMLGQLVSEGFIDWKMKPWKRRILTRVLAILPCWIMVFTTGRRGIAELLNASQVVLSLLLPFLSAPLIYFTCNKKFMVIELKNDNPAEMDPLLHPRSKFIDFSNGKIMAFASVLVWGCISFLNLYLIVQFLRGKDIHF